MLTTDQLLLILIDKYNLTFNSSILEEDKKILLSLGRQIKKGVFLTEKQGNLLIKLLKNNQTYFENLTLEESFTFTNPFFSQEYRLLTEIRKIYFSNDQKQTIAIEFTYDKNLKKKLNDEFSISFTRGLIYTSSSKMEISSNEYNIKRLIDLIKNDNFNIDPEIMHLYDKINETIQSNLDILNITHKANQKLYDSVTTKFTNQENINLLLLDRRIRYQYNYNSIDTNDSLEFKIANRNTTQIWIKEQEYSFNDILIALQKLERFPLLIIFDDKFPEDCLILLEKLYNFVIKYQPDSKVGIYFRFNSNVNKEFNQKISEYKFNQYLDHDTNIVGLSIKQLPKFILKSTWYPNSVFSSANNFRPSKVYTYCNKSDLIICHSSLDPLTRNYYAIV